MRPLGIDGAWLTEPLIHTDHRGSFREWFRRDQFEAATGRPFGLAQANCSISAPGVVRGIHFADVPPGQAKYVTCVTGAVLDVVVDVRVGSPTFGQWEAVRLETASTALFISEGLGHAFMALPGYGVSIMMYLQSEPYSAATERAVDPFDPGIGIDWPGVDSFILSSKDALAPSLGQALREGWLPKWQHPSSPS